MQSDPIGTAGGINLYAYVGNDPLNLIDPFGFAADSPPAITAPSPPQNDAAVAAPETSTFAAPETTQTPSPTTSVTSLNAEAPVVQAAYLGGPFPPQNFLFPCLVSTEGCGGGGAGGGGNRSNPNNLEVRPNADPLQRLHSEETFLSNNLSSYNYWSSKSTQEIINSLAPNGLEPLIANGSVTILNGNTRIFILQQRGVDINSLPRTPYP
jgi:uncharacterized protein RhaS with RHS repeats